MIIKLDRKYAEVLQALCAKTDYKCEVFSMENAPLMVQVRITWFNNDINLYDDLTPVMAFYLAASMMCEMDIQDLKKIYKI